MHMQHTEPAGSRRNDWQTIRALLPYLWDYRGRAGLALAFLVLSKLAIVGVPLALKEIVDYLNNPGQSELALPIALLLGYGALRLFGSAFNELRDVVFAKVRHAGAAFLGSWMRIVIGTASVPGCFCTFSQYRHCPLPDPCWITSGGKRN